MSEVTFFFMLSWNVVGLISVGECDKNHYGSKSVVCFVLCVCVCAGLWSDLYHSTKYAFIQMFVFIQHN